MKDHPIRARSRAGLFHLSFGLLIAIASLCRGATNYVTMPFRSGLEASAGLTGGGEEQFQTSIARSRTNPSVIIFGQDMGGVWISEDEGVNWRPCGQQGLETFSIQWVAIHPDDENIFFCAGSESWDTTMTNKAGIYRSTNKGATWTRVLTLDWMHHWAHIGHICYDNSSPRRWYATITFREPSDGGPGGSAIYRSPDDNGQNWQLVANIPTTGSGSAVHGKVIAVFQHPQDDQTIFLCTMAGLWKTTNAWTATPGNVAWTKVSGTGSPALPDTGAVQRVEINPADGNEMYVVVDVGGNAEGRLMRTTNGGGAWTEIAKNGCPAAYTAAAVYVARDTNGLWQPVGSRTLYLIAKGGASGPDGRLRVSQNGGASWTLSNVQGRPRHNPDANWDGNLSMSANTGVRPGRLAGLSVHPTNPNKAFGVGKAHNFRTTDKGASFVYSGQGFTGLVWSRTLSGIAFHKTNHLDFVAGIYDKGFLLTKDGGSTYWDTYVADGLVKSVQLVMKHPTAADTVVIGSGSNNAQILYKTTVANPEPGLGTGSDWTQVHPTAIVPVWGQWNWTNANIVYLAGLRSTDQGASFGNYPATVGAVCAVWPDNHNTIYGRDWNGTTSTTTIYRSTDAGATAQVFVTMGWNIHVPLNDPRFPLIVPAPGFNGDRIFTESSTSDLARYDKNTNTWKTDYNLRSRCISDNGSLPGLDPKISSVAIDPQDANVMYVTFYLPGYNTVYRSLNAQSNSPTWTNITYDLHRAGFSPRVVVHPLTGDMLYGCEGIGELRVLPPPGPRSHPSLLGGGAPSAPSGLTATVAASPNNISQINLSWSNVSNETGYKIERKKGAGGAYAQIGTTGVNVTTFNDTTCGAGTTYYYRVRAYNGGGDSGYSNEANATTAEITSGRVGHWKLNESGSTTTAVDSDDVPHNGTLTSFSFSPSPWVAGKINNGLSFDGVDDHVDVGNPTQLQLTGAMTVSAWIKVDSFTNSGRIISKLGQTNVANGWSLNVEAASSSAAFMIASNATTLRWIESAPISTGTWIHVTGVYQPSTAVRIYVNAGTPVSNTTSIPASQHNNALNVNIGRRPNGVGYFDGTIDDVRVFNRVLSAAEITAIYRAGL